MNNHETRMGMYRQGMNDREIAEAEGTTISVINYWRNLSGLPSIRSQKMRPIRHGAIGKTSKWQGVPMEQEHKRLLNLVDSMGEQLEKTDKLLDMLRPDIEMKERCILNDERLIELIAAYRQIRPK